jgi:hypothetical protein
MTDPRLIERSKEWVFSRKPKEKQTQKMREKQGKVGVEISRCLLYYTSALRCRLARSEVRQESLRLERPFMQVPEIAGLPSHLQQMTLGQVFDRDAPPSVSA